MFFSVSGSPKVGSIKTRKKHTNPLLTDFGAWPSRGPLADSHMDPIHVRRAAHRFVSSYCGSYSEILDAMRVYLTSQVT